MLFVWYRRKTKWNIWFLQNMELLNRVSRSLGFSCYFDVSKSVTSCILVVRNWNKLTQHVPIVRMCNFELITQTTEVWKCSLAHWYQKYSKNTKSTKILITTSPEKFIYPHIVNFLIFLNLVFDRSLEDIFETLKPHILNGEKYRLLRFMI